MTALVVDWHEDLLGKATATFSPNRAYRYALTRRWAAGPLTAFLMLNPSTADAFTNDATIRRCIGFARRWGSAGLLVVNVFALRATNPDVLLEHPDPVGPDNDRVIAAALPAAAATSVVAAWGTHRRLPARIPQIRALLDQLGLPLLCLGVTKAGYPRHPLYLPNTSPVIPYPERTPAP